MAVDIINARKYRRELSKVSIDVFLQRELYLINLSEICRKMYVTL